MARGEVALTVDQARYIRKVLRLPVGHAVDAVVYGSAEALHTHLDQRGPVRMLVVERTSTLPPPPGPPLTMVLAFLKASKMEAVLRAGTELGVDALWPAVARRSVPDPTAGGIAMRMARWEEIVVNACQQCGRPHPTRIHEPAALETAARELSGAGAALVAMVPSGGTGHARLELPHGRPVALFVGPEGDFTPEEVSALEAAGATRLSLAGHVLRSETAAFAGAAILLARMGRL